MTVVPAPDSICVALGWSRPVLRDEELGSGYLATRTGASPGDAHKHWLVSTRHLDVMRSMPLEEIPLTIASGKAPKSFACSELYWSDVVVPYLSKRLSGECSGIPIYDGVCEHLGWWLDDGKGAAVAEGCYRAPDSREGIVGETPWYVSQVELSRFKRCPLDEIPYYLASGVDRFTGDDSCRVSTYSTRYLHDVVVPYMSARMELGI